MPSRRCEPPGARSRSSRPRRSGTTGSRTATGSSTTCGRRRGSCFALPLFLLVLRARRSSCGARTRTSSTHIGFRARCPRSRPASRSCSSCGARTSRLPGACAPLVRRLVRRAGVVVCASTGLAGDARALGARDVHVIPSGVAIPETVGEPEEPAHILYVGRLSEEKGVRELASGGRGPAARRRRRRAAAHAPAADGRVRPAGRARSLLRARLDRRRPVAARGIWRDRPRGDGSRPARGRLRGRGARRCGGGRRDGPPRATARSARAARGARAAARRRGASADGWAPRAAAVPASGSRWRPLRARRSASTTGSRRGRSGPASRRGSGRASGARGARRPR